MKEQKLKCEIEGYDGTHFNVGQVWETIDSNIKAKIIEISTSGNYPIICEYYDRFEDRTFENTVDIHGKYQSSFKYRLDLTKLISTESTSPETASSKELPPKPLSEYLKENGAYEEFIENYVEYYLEHIDYYTGVDLTYVSVNIPNMDVRKNAKYDCNYWYILYLDQPKNLIYDMNEVVFAEVNRRISEQESQPESDPKFTSENLTENSIVYDMDEIVSAKFITTEEFDQILEQKTSKRYMVFVEGKNTPRYIHNSYASAETEAKRLSTKLVGLKVSIVEIVKEFKSKVVITELLK